MSAPAMRARARTRIALAAAVGFLAVGGAAPGVTLAVPPGGAVEMPRGATVTLDATTVAPGGQVVFRGAGYESGEVVSVKLDDGEVRTTQDEDVFATATAGSEGTVTGAVSLAAAGAPYRTALATGGHSIRLLSSTSKGSRSIGVKFTVGASAPGAPAGSGEPAAPAPTPGTSTPATTTPGPTATPKGASPSPAAPKPGTQPTRRATVASTALRVSSGRRVALRLRGASTPARVRITVRTTARVKVGAKRRTLSLTRSTSKRLKGATTMKVTLTLTARGAATLRKAGRLKVRVRVAPTSGSAATTRVLTLKR